MQTPYMSDLIVKANINPTPERAYNKVARWTR
jgi:hypothetical protein